MSLTRRNFLIGAASIITANANAFPYGLATPPTIGIVFAGDSRMGSVGDPPFLALGNPSTGDSGLPNVQETQTYYSRTLSSVPVLWRNMGISGTRLNTNGFPDLVPLAPLCINPIAGVAPFQGLKLIFINGIGVNDLCVGSFGDGNAPQYAAACAVLNVSVKNAWVAQGATVRTAICTVPPANNGMTQSNWSSFNSTVTSSSWQVSNGIDADIDLQSQSQMGPWGAQNNTALYSDGLHYTAFGSGLFTPILQSGLNAIIATF